MPIVGRREREDAHVAIRGIVLEIVPGAKAAAVISIGHDEQDAATGEMGELTHDGADGITQTFGVAAGGAALFAVRERRVDGRIEVVLENLGRGCLVVVGLEDGAVESIDRDVILRLERRGDPR